MMNKSPAPIPEKPEFCETKLPANVRKWRQPFAPSALKLWEAIPEAHRQQILENVYCSHCREVRRIEDFTGVKEPHDLVLRGFCATCGNVVVRLLETP